MAFQRRRRSTRNATRAPARPRRTQTVRSNKRAFPKRTRKSAPAQTIRIVLEQPTAQPLGVPTSLPEQVGAVQASSPRKARF